MSSKRTAERGGWATLLSEIAQAIGRGFRSLHRQFLAAPSGETTEFLACWECITTGCRLCKSCLARKEDHRRSGWTSTPDWWVVGTPVLVLGEWVVDPTQITRIDADVAALAGRQPSGCCFPITRIRPLSRQ
jgi:hypothetical protein